MGSSMGIQPQKTQTCQKIFCYITVYRAFLADQFGKNNFLISITNNGANGKIFKNVNNYNWPIPWSFSHENT